MVVTGWVLSRAETPYSGVRREQGFPNLWWGTIPGSGHDRKAVVCSYWIEEKTPQGPLRQHCLLGATTLNEEVPASGPAKWSG